MNDMHDLPYTTPGEFLELFGIDTTRKGAADFCELVRRAALVARFPELHVGCYQVALLDMGARHNSPTVYWGNMKRAIAPALEAGRDTLGALLGFSIPGDGEVSTYALANALAGSLALLAADWYRTLCEQHTAGDRPDDLQMPVLLAQEADRREAEQIAAQVRSHQKRRNGGR